MKSSRNTIQIFNRLESRRMSVDVLCYMQPLRDRQRSDSSCINSSFDAENFGRIQDYVTHSRI